MICVSKKVRLQNYKKMSFQGTKGDTVEYALATLIDDEGAIVEVTAVPDLDVKVPSDGTAMVAVFMGSAKDGRRVAKTKLVDFKA